jgi:hypothetical protein
MSKTFTKRIQVNNIAYKLIKSIEIVIGNETIDKHYGEWMDIWNQLTKTDNDLQAIDSMQKGKKIYIPLQFWFCRNPGLALPLIALKQHSVKINIEFATRNEVLVDFYKKYRNFGDYEDQLFPQHIDHACLSIDYVYLDPDHRRSFAQKDHDYLIDQVQYNGRESFSSSVNLSFHYNVKELIWVIYETAEGEHVATRKEHGYNFANLQFNYHPRLMMHDRMYYQIVQPYQHHTRVPMNTGINSYSFALKPEEHQPSGSCNMSKIDKAELVFDTASVSSNTTISVYAVNYNCLRVSKGLASLGYCA